MNEPKPIVVGYVRDRPGEITPTQMYEMQGRLIRHALSMGLSIGYLFVEKDSLSQNTFDSALAKFGNSWGRRYLLVPGSDHLEHVGQIGETAVFDVVQHLTAQGIEVLIVP